MTNYTRKIEMPKTKRDGLANFVQMIINQIEAGNPGEALLKAVDLLQDIESGIYDNAMTDAKGYNAMAREMESRHADAVIAAGRAGVRDGVAQERARMAAVLGLAA